MHVFPNVYKLVEEDTARMRIFPLHEEIEVQESIRCRSIMNLLKK